MSCGKERRIFEIQKDIESIKGNNPEKTIEVSQAVLKRLDIIAESIFLPDYMLDESEAHFKAFQFFTEYWGGLGVDFIIRLCDVFCQPQYTELHKDITYLFLIKYIDDSPCFMRDNSIWKSLRIFHAKRMLFVANWFVREHVRSTDRDFKDGVSASHLELKLKSKEQLYKARVGKIKQRVGIHGRELICPYDLNWLIQIQKNEGFVKYCIDAGLSLMENELKPFLDEVKDWHDMIESPAYGINGVCITKYDILYKEYFIQKCLEIVRGWDWSRFEDCPDLKFGMSDMPNNRYPSNLNIWLD